MYETPSEIFARLLTSSNVVVLSEGREANQERIDFTRKYLSQKSFYFPFK